MHALETEIAADVGVSAAIVLNHIVYWCEKNKSENRNFHDGRYWMYSSGQTIADNIPYLGIATIKRALTCLVDNGYLQVGNYNKATFDRTHWYTPSDMTLAIYAKSANASNQTDTISQCQFDTDNTKLRTNDTPPIIPQGDKQPKKPKKPKPDANMAWFETFWLAYPKKIDKQACIDLWKKLSPDEKLFESIMAGINRSVAFDFRFRDKQYTPSPAKWLRGKSWQDEFDMPTPQAPAPITPPPRNTAFDEIRKIAKEKGAPPPPRDWR